MPSDLAIRCRCGELRGVARGVDARAGNRVVCYCDDCQAFANALGDGERTLDAHGGTDIFQMSSGRLEFTEGLDRLACLRLTPKGAVRWYSSCCNTPIGNTVPARQVPFVGLIHSCMDAAGESLDEVLGPVKARVMARFAIGGPDAVPDADERVAVSRIASIGWKILMWRLRGDHKRSPFFDSKTGNPVAVPRILSESRGT